MSRAKHQNNPNAIQLFPFVAVLLCTMGSLLVLLVGVARSSRNQAVEQAVARKAAAQAQPADDVPRRQLQEVTRFVDQLNLVRTQAEQRLRDDQARLSHLEDHMRRLRDQLDSLKSAAAEMNAMEEEHYDDREQAQREVARLEQLIAETRKTIEQLREEGRSRPKSYAIVPYEGPNGTHRRPIYIECRKNEVVLQPEGIQLTEEDFQPPIGPGNPLAAALRAAREQILREEPTAAGKETEPYPLIIVRPDGIGSYYRVREAIESWDSSFGYELVDNDWDLKFPAADPQIATVQVQAVELARNRLKALAAAAPRAYGGAQSAAGCFDISMEARGLGGGSFDDDERANGSSDSNDAGASFGVVLPSHDDVQPQNRAVAIDSDDDAKKTEPDGRQTLQKLAREAAEEHDGSQPRPRSSNARGKDWAIRNADPGSIAIRRTIQVVVRGDRLAILPENDASAKPFINGKEVPLTGPTSQSVDEFVDALERHIKDWGMAGRGLYWRPVLELNVGPDGQQRADDLVRLLKSSGIEVRGGAVAQHDEGSESHGNH